MRIFDVGLLGGLLVTPLLAHAFDANELQGLWAETAANRYACAPTNRHQRFELSADGKTLTIAVERRTRAGAGKEPERLTLAIIRTEDHALVVRFVGHDDAQDPLYGEWEMSFLGPGVYHWHQLGVHDKSPKPSPMGVRCEP